MGFWDDKKPPKEDFATKEDIKKLEKDIQKLLKDKDQPDTKGATTKLVKGMVKGFNAFNENVKDPSKRIRIARTPENRSEIPIANTTVESPLAPGAGIKRHHISYAHRKTK